MTEQEVISQLVQRLGGATAVGRALGCEAQAVSKWRILGRVPWKWRHPVQSLVQQQGIVLTHDEVGVLTLEHGRQAS